MQYARCGRSGVFLPRLSLGLWHNFGGVDSYDNSKKLLCYAFDRGICHFDLANNYGPPFGSAESTLGRVLKEQLSAYRDELFISTKAGYLMWPGPYGNWGSRKYMLASLDASLQRLGLEYVDVFYSHRYDPETPLEETLDSLVSAVRMGKALYVAISNYPPEVAKQAYVYLQQQGCKTLLHQFRYNMFARQTGEQLQADMLEYGVGGIGFSPLAQGLLSDKYLAGQAPSDSRMASEHGYLQSSSLDAQKLECIRELHAEACAQGMSLVQAALLWSLRPQTMCSSLLGARTTAQLQHALDALSHQPDLSKFDAILAARQM